MPVAEIIDVTGAIPESAMNLLNMPGVIRQEAMPPVKGAWAGPAQVNHDAICVGAPSEKNTAIL